MKTRAFICALAAASLGFSSLSFAQGHDRGREGNRQGHQQRGGDRRGGEHRGPQRGDHDRRGGPGARGDRGEHGRADQYYYDARGPEWRRGGRIPPQYRGRQYVVNDWRGHHLHAPPRGYQWVQVGGDYVLVAIATGIILQILISR